MSLRCEQFRENFGWCAHSGPWQTREHFKISLYHSNSKKLMPNMAVPVISIFTLQFDQHSRMLLYYNYNLMRSLDWANTSKSFAEWLRKIICWSRDQKRHGVLWGLQGAVTSGQSPCLSRRRPWMRYLILCLEGGWSQGSCILYYFVGIQVESTANMTYSFVKSSSIKDVNCNLWAETNPLVARTNCRCSFLHLESRSSSNCDDRYYDTGKTEWDAIE